MGCCLLAGDRSLFCERCPSGRTLLNPSAACTGFPAPSGSLAETGYTSSSKKPIISCWFVLLPSVCLSLPACLFICCLSFYLSIYQSVFLSVVSLSVCLLCLLCLPIHLSVNLLNYLTFSDIHLSAHEITV